MALILLSQGQLWDPKIEGQIQLWDSTKNLA